MIGIMEKTPEEAPPEKEELSTPKQKKADVKTPSITSFFKPTPQTQENKTPDLRSYCQLSKKDVPDQHKLSSDKHCQEESSTTGEKTNIVVAGNVEGNTFSVKEKLKRSKGEGEGKWVSKKPKKQKDDSHHKSDDDEQDFESPPQNRRKRKSRLDSDSIADFIGTEDSKQSQDLSENACMEPCTEQDGMEVCELVCAEMFRNGEDAMNTSTVVSYEDFLRNSVEDEDGAESDSESKDDAETKDNVEMKKSDSTLKGENEHVPELVMLTPPDSRCSQESPEDEQPATPPATQDKRKVEEAADSDVSLRKVITVKAQVHSPIDGRDKDSSPSTPLMLSSDRISRKQGFSPKRLISNVSVLDSSPELTLISVETKEEPKKTGPVYSIFQPKSCLKKKLTKKEAIKENKQEEPVKDLSKKQVKDTDSGDKEKRTNEKQEESVDKQDVMNKQEVGEVVVKRKEEKKGTTKEGTLTGQDKTVKHSNKVSVVENGSGKGSSIASSSSTKSKSFAKNTEEKEPGEEESVPTRRVLRARVAKKSTDPDSSLDEFDDIKPLKRKADKQTKTATLSSTSNKASAKAEVKEKKKGLDRSKSSEPPKFKSSLIDGSKGQGSIKLKLTAIKASPKQSQQSPAAPSKSKERTSDYFGFQTQTSRQLLTKKNTQTAFPQSKSTVALGKVEKANSLNKKGKMEKTKEKSEKVTEKKNGDGAQKQTPRRRSSSRNKPKTPPKPAAKLAPIFTKQGQLAAAKKFKQESIMAAIADSIPADEASRDSLTDSKDGMSDLGGPVLGFNMLEQLKMETTLPQRDTSMQLTKACHVLQKDDTNPLWNLPSPGLANWKLCRDLEPVPKTSQNLQVATPSISSLSSSYIFKLSEGHPPVNESDKKAAMDEILKANPKFPVQKVFKMYQAKRNGETQKKEEDKSDIQATDQVNREAAASSGSVPSGKGSKLSRGKRKAEDVDDEDNSARRKIARRSGRGCARRSLEASLDGEPSDGGTGAGGGEERSLRRSSRRSSRRLSRMEEMEDNKEGDGKEEEQKVEEREGKKDTVVEESQEEKRRAGMLWTEKYQPSAVSEMIGNSTICRKFSSWLTEWKKKTQKMKEKTRNAQGKDKRRSIGSRRIDSDDESDDDFCCFDSDDSDEEDGLCNTILLSGPHGVGKTSLVYACAQELGFEVFEVNASSRRNGRQILSELGEGTQSHQVARQPGLSSASFFNPSPTTSGSAKIASPKKKKPVLPKAFAGFVKMGSSSSASSKRSPVKKPSAKKSPKKSVKQSPRKKSSSSQLNGSQAGITKPKVTSTSLILFDEVDIIFEEDKGFLSTVMSFMESSKRPIVLTTSDPRFSFCLTSRYDELTFKPPPLNTLVSHLKLLCLAEDFPISHQDLKLVVEFMDRDIRRCLQHLHFWVCSGGMPERIATRQGTAGKDGETGLRVDAPKENQEKLPIAMSDTGDMDTSDMKGDESSMKGMMEELTQELIDLETRIIAVGEYYSMKGYKPQDVLKMMEEMGLTSKQETSTDTCHESNSIQEILTCSYRTGLGNYCGLFESIAGLGNIAGPVIDSLNLLKKLDDPAQLAAVLRAFHDLNIDAAHFNLPQILSSLTTSKDTRERNASPSSNHKPSSKSSDCEFTVKEKQKISKLGGDLIDVMAEHAERMSAMDMLLPHDQRQDSHLNRYGGNEWWHPLLMPGLNDNEDWTGDDYELTDVRPRDSRSEHSIADVNCCLEAMCLRDCVKRCRRTITEARQDGARWEEIEQNVLPSFDESCLQIEDIKSDGTLRETNSAVVRRLPDYLYTNHSALSLDYLPMLRGICRFEELRKEANLKRRFFHYLDSISFCLKPVTHLSLASIFNQTHHVNMKPSL